MNLDREASAIADAAAGAGPGGWNRLASAEAELVMRNAGFQPLDAYRNSRAPWRCRCTVCGSEVSPSLGSVRRGRGCRACKYQKHSERQTVPVHVAIDEFQSAGFEPLGRYIDASTPCLSRCLTCDEEVSPRLKGIRLGYRCRICAGSAPLNPEKAIAMALAARFRPLVSYPGADRPWLCECATCGSRIRPRLTTINRGHGCLVCSYPARCVRPNEPAILYVVYSREHRALKPGIAKAHERNRRLKMHGWAGWEVVHTQNFLSGSQAYKVEQRVLSHLRYDRGFASAVTRDLMKYGGWTETVSCDDITADDLVALIRLTAEGVLSDES